MNLKYETSTDNRKFDSDKLNKIVSSTYANSRTCQEIFEVIQERLNSKRSTIKNIIKVNSENSKQISLNRLLISL